MMNNANEISAKTTLFGYIGEHAGVSRFSTLLNKLLKQNSKDAMIIPMNIRYDDLYFTVSNMKNSHLSGAVISSEYTSDVVEILDNSSSLVQRSGICDLIFKEGNALRGELFGVRVLTEYLKDARASKIAVLGISGYAKAFSFLSCGFSVSYFHDNLEELMAMTQELELQDADINRIASGMQVDLSGFDAVLDFSQMEHLGMITSLAPLSFDMKNEKQFSPLKQRANELGREYKSYDAMLEKLVDTAYKMISK